MKLIGSVLFEIICKRTDARTHTQMQNMEPRPKPSEAGRGLIINLAFNCDKIGLSICKNNMNKGSRMGSVMVIQICGCCIVQAMP